MPPVGFDELFGSTEEDIPMGLPVLGKSNSFMGYQNQQEAEEHQKELEDFDPFT